ncbi:hypothetical protein JXB22_01960, partial [candidate division WOR-3 bacterium]|nr:hypothetical protein [candidate division WOR-3 bacterium]
METNNSKGEKNFHSAKLVIMCEYAQGRTRACPALCRDQTTRRYEIAVARCRGFYNVCALPT